ncbi:MAG: MotA/TolQ/ExbB proton channel family protein [Deltaproteobacteria bacterium]|nr:MotA/TolQ/ExbB proton channel family protein [Deltaproteobacteria bacterium]
MSSIISFSHIGWVAILVLVVLVILSVSSWAIIFYKWILFNRLIKKDKIFFNHIFRRKDWQQFSYDVPDSLLSQIFSVVENSDLKNIDAVASHKLDELESGLSFVASVGSTAPFIGLFGTVWGIMSAFSNIGLTESASIAVVAPGISEALFTTAAGLFAAIPAVIGYNILSHKLSIIAQSVEDFKNIMKEEKRGV